MNANANKSGNTSANANTGRNANPIVTHASGDLSDYGMAIRGNEPESGPLVALEPHGRCIALHFYEGFVTILPIRKDYKGPSQGVGSSSGGSTTRKKKNPWEFLGRPHHCRIEERDVFSMTFLLEAPSTSSQDSNANANANNSVNAVLNSNASTSNSTSTPKKYMPQLAFLHQDSRGNQHVVAHSVDLAEKSLVLYSSVAPLGLNNRKKFVPPLVEHRLKKSRVDGFSGMIVAVPPMGWTGYHDDDHDHAANTNANTSIGTSTSTYTGMDEDDELDGKLASSPSNTTPTRTGTVTGTGTGTDEATNNETAGAGMSASNFGGILVLGEKQITYHDTSKNINKILPISNFVTMTCTHVHPLGNSSTAQNSGKQAVDVDVVRYLLGDENGKLHILAVVRSKGNQVTGLHLDTLGVTNVSSSLLYLERGLVFVGSQTADSQFIQILDQPVEVTTGNTIEDRGMLTSSSSVLMDGRNVTYVNVLEEYTNLGPIVDFEMMPTSHNSYNGNGSGVGGAGSIPASASSHSRQCMAVTASGAEKDGTIRFVRNGIGMIEHASVELAGIKGIWNVRKAFHDKDDAFLIQSYVGETRILGVVLDEDDIEDISGVDDLDDREDVGASLAEVNIDGFDSTRNTLYAGNVFVEVDDKSGVDGVSVMVQITEKEIRVISLSASHCIAAWSPEDAGLITVASANEAGQIGIVLRGGKLVYLQVAQGDMNSVKIEQVGSSHLGQEISCIDLNPFDQSEDWENGEDFNSMDVDTDTSMDIDQESTFKRRVVKSGIIAVGLWDDSTVQILSLGESDTLKNLCRIDLENATGSDGASGRQIMVRSLCLVTLSSSSSSTDGSKNISAVGKFGNRRSVNMMLIGLGDGILISFVVSKSENGSLLAISRKEVSIGTRALNLEPFENHVAGGGKCVLATGDRPTVIYLSSASGSSNKNARLCYSNIHLTTEDEDLEDEMTSTVNRNCPLFVNVASQFHSSMLFDMPGPKSDGNYSLCISDDSMLRLGVIDDMQKLHVTTHKLDMPPRKVSYDENSRLLCVGCIDNGLGKSRSSQGDEINMGNCIRFFDDTSFEEIDRFDLDPYEMILSMVSTRLKVVNDELVYEGEKKTSDTNGRAGSEGVYCQFLVIGTGYGYPDEDEPSRGRIIILQCTMDRENNSFSRRVKEISEVQVKGGVFAICPFYDGSILATINSKTRLCRLIGGSDKNDGLDLKVFGAGHHGHVLSLHVRSLAEDRAGIYEAKKPEQLAIVGDMVRSISVVKYYPEFDCLEEIARDFNQNWVTAVEMLTDDVYLGAENFSNIYALRRNPRASSEEIRCRLDTVGLFNFGEMINKFVKGNLAMSTASNVAETSNKDTLLDGSEGAAHAFKLVIGTGSQTLFGTVDGTLGSVIGLDARTTAFFLSMQRAMVKNINPIGDLRHGDFRSHRGQRKQLPSRGFIDGDLIESFSDLDSITMELIVRDMNKENKWDVFRLREKSKSDNIQKDLTLNDVLTMVEDMSMTH